jgi:hypothetical protein
MFSGFFNADTHFIHLNRFGGNGNTIRREVELEVARREV